MRWVCVCVCIDDFSVFFFCSFSQLFAQVDLRWWRIIGSEWDYHESTQNISRLQTRKKASDRNLREWRNEQERNPK